GLPRKHTIIALAPAYHGNTLLALSASAREHYRAFYREWLVDVHRIPAPYPYRCPCRGLDAGCPICTGDVLEDPLARVAAGLAAVRYLKAHRLVERCAEMGKELQRRLAPLGRLPYVGDVRGRGLLAGVEFVEDKLTRAPLPRAAKFAEAFTEAAQGEGLVVWPNVGHAD